MSGFTATDPRTGHATGRSFEDASPGQVAAAVQAADDAAPDLDAAGDHVRADLLRAIAHLLAADADRIVAEADRETALGTGRLTSELARTTGQLRFLADLVANGSYREPVIDPGDPDATPPRPDLRRLLVPRGPVAVFGAGNFPLAFGVPGGDTASALAVGCPVVFKGHPDHPATSQHCAEAIIEAVRAAGLPRGTFTLLQGAGTVVGASLVTAPVVRAVGFTGSLRGGRALFDLAVARPDPIPVHAEMGSLNPVFVTAAALDARGEDIAQGFVDSMNLGTGQFCTKPGLVVLPAAPGADRFASTVAALTRDRAAGTLLSPRLRDGLTQQLSHTLALDDVRLLARGPMGEGVVSHNAVVLEVDADVLTATPDLLEEHFGPVAIVVRCTERTGPVDVALALPGGLTASLHGQPGDDVEELVAALRDRVGRLVFGGFPTGVAVTWAMQHGGPWPATTDAAHTSVGAMAVRRWLRPVAYQDAPQELLPPELRDANPRGLTRLVAGRLTSDPIGHEVIP